MLRMEIALFLVLAFVAYIYFSAGRKHSLLHKIFSVLLITTLIHLALDGATVYTVNHLDTVPLLLNNILHRLFIGTMVFAVYLFYHYIAVLVQDKVTGARRDLTISPVKSGTLAFGYYFATLLSTLLVCFVAAAVCLLYLAYVGWYLTLTDVMLLLLDIFLLVLFGTALSSIVNCCLKSQGQMSAVGTVISAGYAHRRHRCTRRIHRQKMRACKRIRRTA